ncbi:MAG: hypothetical protein IT437_12605 [Phycisphaerales bacterium]|nr:hypothetical protein [Phycisphaerales bacterium]
MRLWRRRRLAKLAGLAVFIPALALWGIGTAAPFVADVALPAQRVFTVEATRGLFSLTLVHEPVAKQSPSVWDLLALRRSRAEFGTAWRPYTFTASVLSSRARVWILPWWLVIAAAGAPAALAFIPWRRWRRRGTCRQCGYSLAGLAAGAACPECGTSPACAPRGASGRNASSGRDVTGGEQGR